MLILIGAVPERLVHGDQSRPLFPTSLAPPGPAIGFSTATLIQGNPSLTCTLNNRTVNFFIMFDISYYSKLGRKYLSICLVSDSTNDCFWSVQNCICISNRLPVLRQIQKKLRDLQKLVTIVNIVMYLRFQKALILSLIFRRLIKF